MTELFLTAFFVPREQKEQGMSAVFPDAKDETDTHEAREARREAEQQAINSGTPSSLRAFRRRYFADLTARFPC